ncbi:MAG: hypothetical protein Q7S22_01710 [Candidatus Micrarchaeota archaeon]|nr:hypothetical protein [Candidatus Micrarchaeota archaeon]
MYKSRNSIYRKPLATVLAIATAATFALVKPNFSSFSPIVEVASAHADSGRQLSLNELSREEKLIQELSSTAGPNTRQLAAYNLTKLYIETEQLNKIPILLTSKDLFVQAGCLQNLSEPNIWSKEMTTLIPYFVDILSEPTQNKFFPVSALANAANMGVDISLAIPALKRSIHSSDPEVKSLIVNVITRHYINQRDWNTVQKFLAQPMLTNLLDKNVKTIAVKSLVRHYVDTKDWNALNRLEHTADGSIQKISQAEVTSAQYESGINIPCAVVVPAHKCKENVEKAEKEREHNQKVDVAIEITKVASCMLLGFFTLGVGGQICLEETDKHRP